MWIIFYKIMFDGSVITFSRIASQIISAINLLLGIGVTFNAVSYFLSDDKETLICKIK